MKTSRAVFEKGIRRTVERYAGLGAKVIVLLQIPQQTISPVRLYSQIYSEMEGDAETATRLIEDHSVSFQAHFDFQSFNRGFFSSLEQSGVFVKIIDPDPHFCKFQKCSLGSSDTSFYFDGDHVNKFGAARLDGVFREILRK